MTTKLEGEKKPTVVCVFCGSIPGNNPKHLESARQLAHIFHKENITLVYGGGTNGIMGELARTLVSLSGPQAVHGVIPTALVKVEDGYRSTHTATSTAGKLPERTLSAKPGTAEASELLHESEYGLTTLTPDMHTRKRAMAQKVMEGGPGSGFIALAGGFGTMEEIMEMVTWNQLGIHSRGIVLLNIDRYYDGLIGWLKNSVQEGFVSEMNEKILVECTRVEDVLDALRNYKVSQGRFQLNWGEE